MDSVNNHDNMHRNTKEYRKSTLLNISTCSIQFQSTLNPFYLKKSIETAYVSLRCVDVNNTVYYISLPVQPPTTEIKSALKRLYINPIIMAVFYVFNFNTVHCFNQRNYGIFRQVFYDIRVAKPFIKL